MASPDPRVFSGVKCNFDWLLSDGEDKSNSDDENIQLSKQFNQKEQPSDNQSQKLNFDLQATASTNKNPAIVLNQDCGDLDECMMIPVNSTN